LPSTQLIRRRESARGWGLGVTIGIGVNALMIAALVVVTHVLHEPIADPPMVVRLNRVEPPPELETQEPEVTQSTTETPFEMPELPLPPLDLATAGDAAVQLPILPLTDAMVDLPIGIPAFSTSLPGAGELSLPPSTALTFDEPAQLTAAFDLDRFYPRAAKTRGVEGESAVRLAIDVNGRVTACTLIRSSPPGVFDEAAVRLGPTLRFRPARRADQAVPSILIQNIVWKLKQ
jgi:protein TonB